MVHVRDTRRTREKTTACPSALADARCLFLAGPVIGARSLNPIPSRTRPLNSSAPMVLCLKTRESRSLPGLPRTCNDAQATTHTHHIPLHDPDHTSTAFASAAGWSSPVARQAHNLKVTGSNPVPATNPSQKAPNGQSSGGLRRSMPTDPAKPPMVDPAGAFVVQCQARAKTEGSASPDTRASAAKREPVVLSRTMLEVVDQHWINSKKMDPFFGSMQ